MPKTSMQLLDRDRYFAGKSWKPGHETMEGETGTRHNELSKSGKREGGRGGEMVEYMLPCKTTLSVNAKVVKAANTLLYRSTWNPDACTCQKHRCLPLVVNSVKLHYPFTPRNKLDC